LTRNQVQRRSLLALADPLLYYSMYGVAVSYIGNGNTTSPMPLIPVAGGVRVMPSLGYGLAPHGGEWTLRTAFQVNQKGGDMRRLQPKITNVTLRVGNTGASATWGLSGRAADVLRIRGLPIGVAVDIWNQPELLAEQTSSARHFGGGAVATVILPIPRMLRPPWTQGIQVTAGYKSQGFVPGEQLSGGAVLRAGITLR
jgi:hypothetical protein